MGNSSWKLRWVCRGDLYVSTTYMRRYTVCYFPHPSTTVHAMWTGMFHCCWAKGLGRSCNNLAAHKFLTVLINFRSDFMEVFWENVRISDPAVLLPCTCLAFTLTYLQIQDGYHMLGLVIIHVNPRLCPTLVGWNLGLTWKCLNSTCHLTGRSELAICWVRCPTPVVTPDESIFVREQV